MSRIASRLLATAKVLGTPGGFQALATWRPFSLTSFEMARRMRAQGLAYRTIIDGGANIGQFARAMVETFPDPKVVSFEPLPEEAATLRRNLRGCTRWSMKECALGDQDGTIEFFRNDYSVASSALPIEAEQISSFPETAKWTSLTVPVRTLDSALAAEELSPPVLLKLDLQGYERTALTGAGETLKRCDAVLLETAFTSLYRGEPHFDDLFLFMKEAGFRLLRPLDFLAGKKGEILQMDALFVRESTPP